MISRIVNLLKQTKVSQLAVNSQACTLCNWPLQLKIFNDEMGVRCTRCGASAVTQSLAQVFSTYIQDKQPLKIYELSSNNSWVNFLHKTQHHITVSELFDDVPIGISKNGITCQDVQNLTFKNESFDVCTSLEVFEHVADDLKGFHEIFRVLKPYGKLIFSVPLDLENKTVERTRIENGKRIDVLPPEYHSDRLRGVKKVFCYRNYGYDINERLTAVGFKNSQLIHAEPNSLFGFGRTVIYAQK